MDAAEVQAAEVLPQGLERQESDPRAARAQAHFLRLTLDKLEPVLLADRTVTAAEYAEAVAVLNDPSRTIVMPRGAGTFRAVQFARNDAACFDTAVGL